MESHASFSAVLRLPPSHTAPPVLEEGGEGSYQISATSLPDVSGASDEVIDIKPQDRAVTGENAINFQEAM